MLYPWNWSRKTNREVSSSYVLFSRIVEYRHYFVRHTFFHEKRRFFTIEDVIYYKGKNIQSSLYLNKLRLFESMFTTDLGQNSYSSSFITFGLPIMGDNTDAVLAQIDHTQRIMYFQYRYFNKPMICRVKAYIVMQANDSQPPPAPQLDIPVVVSKPAPPAPPRPQLRTNNKQ